MTCRAASGSQIEDKPLDPLPPRPGWRLCAGLALTTFAAVAQPIEPSNSNFWPVFMDPELGFRISYPPSWLKATGRSANVRFSMSPPKGPGNCNVVAKQRPIGNRPTQAELSAETRSLGIDPASWTLYLGDAASNVRVVNARRSSVNGVPAIVGVIDADIENLQGTYTRRMIIAMTSTPLALWSINCGVAASNRSAAVDAFNRLAPEFEKVVGSFVLP